MKQRLHLETRFLGLEAGIVLVLVNLILLLVSWVAAHMYVQSTLSLHMAANMDAQLQAQMKAEDELIEIEQTIAQGFKQDPEHYLAWHREQYKHKRLRFIPDSASCISELRCSGRDLYTLSVNGYRSTYWIRIDIENPTNNKVQRLSWSTEGH